MGLANGAPEAGDGAGNADHPEPKGRRTHEPHVGPNIQKFRGWGPETWRYRIGPWRFFYEIHEDDRTVYLTAVDHRGQAYR